MTRGCDQNKTDMRLLHLDADCATRRTLVICAQVVVGVWTFTLSILFNTINCLPGVSDIQHCSRVAKIDPKNTRPRNILVKFSNQKRRDDFIKSVIEFNKKKKSEDRLNTSHLGMAGDKTAIFVSEHLSLENKQLHASARIRAKQLGYKYVWVRNGKIFIRKSEETSHICVRNLDTLKKML
ncbi:hypothetical protein ACJJTC_008881 [Scirpophaga incertulas]